MFKYEKGQIINWRNNLVFDVTDSKDLEGQPVGIKKNTNGKNQQWKIVYLDETDIDDKIATKGLNKEFGFHINRPFYLVSELPFNRVAEMHSNANIWLRKYRKNVKQQQFWFDERTNTIKNNHYRTYCLEIQSNGKSNNIKAGTGCISRWW